MAASLELFTTLLVSIVKFLRKIFVRKTSNIAPEPGVILTSILHFLLPGNELKQLECLSDIYSPEGIFQRGAYIYLVDPRMSQTAISKLDKGAVGYLQNSPLQGSFLGSQARSPDTRRAIASIFRKSNMEENAPKMIHVIEKTVEKISKDCTVNVNEIALQMALDIVGHVLFGLELDALNGKQDDLIHAMTTILHRTYSLKEISPQSEQFKQAHKKLDDLTSQILEKALRVKTDVKSLARILHDIDGFNECKANMQLFLMAGSETTAASIPVFLYLLVDTPGLQQELQQEADQYISKLTDDASVVPPKLDSALREMLRSCAIAPYISRRNQDVPLALGQYTIPPDSSLRIFTWGIHRRTDLWPQAKTFNPYRFCPSGFNSDKPNTSDPTPRGGQVWIPFGAGARICIGQHLAWLELKLALTYFLRHFTFTRVPHAEPPELCVDWEHAVVHVVRDLKLRVAGRQ